MTLGISGAIDRVLTARNSSVARCGDPPFFGAAAPSAEIAVALFKVVAAGVITPGTPAETIILINVPEALPFVICCNFHDVICCETNL